MAHWEYQVTILIFGTKKLPRIRTDREAQAKAKYTHHYPRPSLLGTYRAFPLLCLVHFYACQ